MNEKFSRFAFEQTLKSQLVAAQARQRPKIVTRTLLNRAVETLRTRGYSEVEAIQIFKDVNDMAKLELICEDEE